MGKKRAATSRQISSIVQAVLDLHQLKDDRAIAIMGCAMLECELGRALFSRLSEMSEKERDNILDNQGQGALATLYAKIWTGFGLGLYKAGAREDLNKIRKIRNIFAHTGEHVDFSDQEIVKYCNQLTGPKNLAQKSMKPEITDPKERYLDTVHHLTAGFNLYAGTKCNRPPQPQFIDY